MRTRSFLAASAVLVSLLSACDGTGSSTLTPDSLADAGEPAAPKVVTQGKVVKTSGSTSSSGNIDTASTQQPVAKGIVGDWSMTTTGLSLNLAIEAGGVGSYTAVLAGASKEGVLTWSGSGSSYTVSLDGKAAPATLSGDTLTVKASTTQTYVLIRVP